MYRIKDKYFEFITFAILYCDKNNLSYEEINHEELDRSKSFYSFE